MAISPVQSKRLFDLCNNQTEVSSVPFSSALTFGISFNGTLVKASTGRTQKSILSFSRRSHRCRWNRTKRIEKTFPCYKTRRLSPGKTQERGIGCHFYFCCWHGTVYCTIGHFRFRSLLLGEGVTLPLRNCASPIPMQLHFQAKNIHLK